MTVTSPAHAYTMGHNAWMRFGDTAVCPFASRTPQWREWYRGWTNAKCQGMPIRRYGV